MYSIPELIADIKQGRMVILVDDKNREDEGDLVIAAEFASPEIINFMLREARGLICLTLSKQQVDRLQLPLMRRSCDEGVKDRPNFTYSIDAREGCSSGSSATDRAHTIQVAIKASVLPQEVVTPGHVLPLCACEGGVFARPGHTEGSVDLVKLAGLNPAAIICEVMNTDGSMARGEALLRFALRYDIKIGSIEDLIEYRMKQEGRDFSILSRQFKQMKDVIIN